MSNYWRLRCLTCNEDGGTTWNHGGEWVKKLARRHKEISAACAMLADVRDECDLEIEVRAQYEYLNLEWLQAHRDHDVRAADEYGKVFALDGEFDPAASMAWAVEWERKDREAMASPNQVKPPPRSGPLAGRNHAR